MVCVGVADGFGSLAGKRGVFVLVMVSVSVVDGLCWWWCLSLLRTVGGTGSSGVGGSDGARAGKRDVFVSLMVSVWVGDTGGGFVRERGACLVEDRSPLVVVSVSVADGSFMVYVAVVDGVGSC